MTYKLYKNKIIINGKTDFNPKHICECGQMFRFYIVDGCYIIVNNQYAAKIIETETGFEILTNNPLYFEHYLDLNFNYSKAKNILSKNKLLLPAIKTGQGIRLVKADAEETIFEFIISANNNIKRIQKIVEKLCEIGDSFSTEFGSFKAFPSAKKLSEMPLDWFETLGAGYRAKYLKCTADFLAKINMNDIQSLSSDDLYKWLINLKGVGPKVASCILLFGFGRTEFFPVDTWVEQVYYNHFYVGDKSRKEIQIYFESMFKEYSGLAQQYLFNAERNK